VAIPPSGIGEAPADGQTYVRNGQSASWVVAPLPSSATPIMDGTAAPGSSAAYARGDHVHPTDASRAPLASPTFTGVPAAPTASPGTNTTQLATTAFVEAAVAGGFIPEAPQDGQTWVRQSGLWVPQQGFTSGFVNKLRNETFDVWQRGTTGIAIGPGAQGSYTADGWWVISNGGASTAQQTNGRGPTLYGLQVNGVAGVTAMTVLHKIESNISAALGNVPVTFQAQIFNATAASITPTLTVAHPSTQDTWPATPTSAPVDVGPVNLQACAAGQWTRVAYTFTVPSASASLGVHVALGFGALTSASVRIAEADCRVTPGLPVGLCANPPPPELRPVSQEIVFCQRYYRRWSSSGSNSSPVPGTAYFVAVGNSWINISLGIPMRVVPTLQVSAQNALYIYYSGNVSSQISAISQSATNISTSNLDNVSLAVTPGTSPAAGAIGQLWTTGNGNQWIALSAEL
jgi:hypothetical protein